MDSDRVAAAWRPEAARAGAGGEGGGAGGAGAEGSRLLSRAPGCGVGLKEAPVLMFPPGRWQRPDVARVSGDALYEQCSAFSLILGARNYVFAENTQMCEL